MKLLNIFVEQLYQTMAIVGTMASVIYIMRALGFHDPLPWQYEYYPACVIGLLVGLFLKNYYLQANCKQI
jgi:hypothetical protein